MKKLIVEVWKKTGLKQLTDTSTPEGMMLVEGVVGRVDSLNRNNRFYPEQEYRKHIKDLTTRIAESNGVLGEMEHPKSMNINLNNVSHKLMEIRIDEDGMVRGKIMLLDTPKGKIAQSIVRSGSPLPISSRGIGKTGPDGRTVLEYMSTFDLVGTAGFAETGLKAISENKDDEGNVISEFYEYSIDANGDVVTQDAFNAIAEAVEAKLVLKYDKILENATNPLDADSIEQIVSEHFASNVDQIQSFLTESNDELIKKDKIEKPAGVKDGDDGKELTNENAIDKAQILEMIQSQFLTVQIPIIEEWTTNHMLPKAAQIQEAWLKNQFTSELCEGLEKWMFESVLPKNAEIQEKWLVENFKNQLIETIQESIDASTNENKTWIANDFTKNLCEGIERFVKQETAQLDIKKIEIEPAAPEGGDGNELTNEGDKIEKPAGVKDGDDGKELTNEGDKIEKPAGVKDGDDGKELTNEGDKIEKPAGVKDGDDGKELTNESKSKYAISSAILENVTNLVAEAKKKKAESDEEKAKAKKDAEDNIDESAVKLEQELAAGPIHLRAMPKRYKHIYKCLTEDQKASINRSAATRILNTNEDVDLFWTNLSLTNENLQLKPGTRAYYRTIQESKMTAPSGDLRANLARMAESMK